MVQKNTKSQDAFYKEYEAAEKLEKTKTVEGIEVKLAVQAHLAEPYWYKYYINIGQGWGYYCDFGIDYAAAKRFFDNINWFLSMLARSEEQVRQTRVTLKDVWRATAKQNDGKDVKVPTLNDYAIVYR